MEEEEKKHVPKFSLSSFFLFFFFLWNFSLVLKLHIEERESKKKEKRRASFGVRRDDATHKKKKRVVLNRGLEPRTFRLRYQSVSGAFLLGERSDQLVK